MYRPTWSIGFLVLVFDQLVLDQQHTLESFSVGGWGQFSPCHPTATVSQLEYAPCSPRG